MRLATLFCTLALLAQTLPAAAQSTPAAPANDTAAIEQQIRQQAYSRCVTDARMGTPGAELQENCTCAADVAIMLLSDEAKQSMADGTFASFQGPKLKGDEMSRDVTLLRACPKVGAHLKQQYCGADATNPHCQTLEQAIQQAQ